MIIPISPLAGISGPAATANAAGDIATATGAGNMMTTTGASSSFGAYLADTAQSAMGTLSSAENLSIKALQGKADTRDVVDAVMNAEQSLNTAVAIRDKIVSAYLDISRMSI